MQLFHAIILSIIEGITEFLPISSTGHLILASTLMRIPQTEFLKTFEIFIQLGAILAIVVLYARSLATNKAVMLRVLMAFIPTALIGFVSYSFVKQYLLGNPWVVVLTLFVGGIALIILEKLHTESSHHVERVEEITLPQAFFIGLAQSVSIIPGVSRAAATIIGALFLGIKRAPSVEFSFLLAIPTMIAATGLDIFKTKTIITTNEIGFLAIGFVGAFFTALVVVKWFVRFVQNNTFIPFGIYRILAALLFYFFVLR